MPKRFRWKNISAFLIKKVFKKKNFEPNPKDIKSKTEQRNKRNNFFISLSSFMEFECGSLRLLAFFADLEETDSTFLFFRLMSSNETKKEEKN